MSGRLVGASNYIGSLDRAALERLASDLGQPRFRARQLLRWIWRHDARSFDEMTDLPLAMRASLAKRFSFKSIERVERQVSSDGTRKYLWRFDDGVSVESVGLPEGDRLTVCFSTQAGCPMACAFCATGASGFARDLSAGEMVRQVVAVGADFGMRVSNAVAMGQGEPFLNYDATLSALRILNDPEALGIGARHLTVSTAGIIPGIERFSTEPEQFTLAVSLHSARQQTRDRLMPGVRRYPLAELRRALAAYVERTNRRPTLEYALIAGVNDTPEELAALVAFTRGLHAHVNLIPANAVAAPGIRRSDPAAVRRALAMLREADVEESVRVERGADIDAACGQLAQRHPQRERRRGGSTGHSPPSAGQSPHTSGA